MPVCLCLSESESESESVPVPVSVSMSVSMSVPVSVSVSVSVSVCLWQDSQQDDGVALARRLRAIGCLQVSKIEGIAANFHSSRRGAGAQTTSHWLSSRSRANAARGLQVKSRVKNTMYNKGSSC